MMKIFSSLKSLKVLLNNKYRHIFYLSLIIYIWFAGEAIAEKTSHIKRLLLSRDCASCNLQGANLEKTYLVNANLRDANLTKCQSSTSKFDGSIFAKCKIKQNKST
ncbi:MAG: pentapeptide repeat-containing protein [Richelia sp. SM1_7_0]|nr:pentapeptide repeat-containing protein [Richelia sp. SM1_7_0]